MSPTAHALAANDPLALHVRESRRLSHWGVAVVVCGLLYRRFRKTGWH